MRETYAANRRPVGASSLAPEIMQRALVAERCALMLVLPFLAVGVYIAVHRERYAILNPRLTEHLFGDEHFRNFAAIVARFCFHGFKICHAAKHYRAHAHKRNLVGGRRLEPHGITRATACAVEFGQCLQFIGVHVMQAKHPNIARILKRENVVVRCACVAVTLYHVHV